MVLHSFMICGLFSRTVRLNTMILMLYQLLPHNFFLLHNQNQHILSFLNLNKSLEQTKKYTKVFEQYSFICRCPRLSNRCTFGFSNQLAGRFAPATELEFNRFWPSPFVEIVWQLITQVNNDLLAD